MLPNLAAPHVLATHFSLVAQLGTNALLAITPPRRGGRRRAAGRHRARGLHARDGLRAGQVRRRAHAGRRHLPRLPRRARRLAELLGALRQRLGLRRQLLQRRGVRRRARARSARRLAHRLRAQRRRQEQRHAGLQERQLRRARRRHQRLLLRERAQLVPAHEPALQLRRDDHQVVPPRPERRRHQVVRVLVQHRERDGGRGGGRERKGERAAEAGGIGNATA